MPGTPPPPPAAAGCGGRDRRTGQPPSRRRRRECPQRRVTPVPLLPRRDRLRCPSAFQKWETARNRFATHAAGSLASVMRVSSLTGGTAIGWIDPARNRADRCSLTRRLIHGTVRCTNDADRPEPVHAVRCRARYVQRTETLGSQPRLTACARSECLGSTQTERSSFSKAVRCPDRPIAGWASTKQSFMATRTRPGADAPGNARQLTFDRSLRDSLPRGPPLSASEGVDARRNDVFGACCPLSPQTGDFPERGK